MTTNKLAPVISVLNLKGGVGKTTITAHVFRVFYHRKVTHTLLVDLDPQFNLTQALLDRSTYDKLREENRTVFQAMEPPTGGSLFDIATSTVAAPSPDKFVQRLRGIRDTGTTLDLAPGDFRLIKYSLVKDQAKLKLVLDRFLRTIAAARREYGLVCIDCNPSSSFITLCALNACSHLLVPVRPDKYSVLGLELLNDFLDQNPSIHPKPELLVVLNGIPRQGYIRTVEDQLRAHSEFGKKVLSTRIHVSKILEARPDYTGFATDKKVPHRSKLKEELEALVDEIAPKLGGESA